MKTENEDLISENAKARNKIQDFLYEAFCIEDGSCRFIKVIDPTPGFSCIGELYKLEDKKRGLFYVTISKPIN